MEPQSCPSEIGQPNNSVQTNHFKVKPMQICAFPMGHYRQTHKNTHIFFFEERSEARRLLVSIQVVRTVWFSQGTGGIFSNS